MGLFSGILFCADCESVMCQQRYQTDTRKQDCYICDNYKRRTKDCTAHFIRTDLLIAGVTENLRRDAARRRELDATEKRIAELSGIFKRLYEDSVGGRISNERFMEMPADYETDQKKLKECAGELQRDLPKTREAAANAEKFMKASRRHTSFEELTPTLLREFVERIVVHEATATNGRIQGKLRRQEIEIYCSFVDRLDLPE